MYENVVFFMLPIFLIYAKFFFFSTANTRECIWAYACMSNRHRNLQAKETEMENTSRQNETETNRIEWKCEAFMQFKVKKRILQFFSSSSEMPKDKETKLNYTFSILVCFFFLWRRESCRHHSLFHWLTALTNQKDKMMLGYEFRQDVEGKNAWIELNIKWLLRKVSPNS